jgi:hypothetical protein
MCSNSSNIMAIMATKKRSVTFSSQEAVTYMVPKAHVEEISNLFYNGEDIANFRQEAILELEMEMAVVVSPNSSNNPNKHVNLNKNKLDLRKAMQVKPLSIMRNIERHVVKSEELLKALQASDLYQRQSQQMEEEKEPQLPGKQRPSIGERRPSVRARRTAEVSRSPSSRNPRNSTVISASCAVYTSPIVSPPSVTATVAGEEQEQVLAQPLERRPRSSMGEHEPGVRTRRTNVRPARASVFSENTTVIAS